MSSEQLGAAQNVLKGNLGGAWDITNGYQDAYTDLGIARRFGGSAAAYSLRDIGAMNGRVVKVRRDLAGEEADAEEDFSASQVQSGALENWVNGKLESTLPADVATAAAAYSLRKVKASYASNAVRIRRSSDDIEVNVLFDSEGKVSANSSILNITEQGGEIGNTTATTLGDFLNPTYTVGTSVESASRTFNSFTANGNTGFTGTKTGGGSSTGGFPYTFATGDVISVSFDLVIADSASPTFILSGNNMGSGSLGTGTTFTSSGSYTQELTATSGTGTHLAFTDGNTGTFTVSNFKVTSHKAEAFVHTWYDQAGTNNAVEATAANQPKVASSGALLSGINFDGNTFLNIGADLMNGTDGTSFMVASNIDIDQETFYLSNRNASTGFHFKNDTSHKGKLSYNFIGSNAQISTNAVVADSSSNKQLFGFVKDSNDTELFNNAVQLADGTASQTYSASSGSNTSIGKQGNSSSAGANKTLVVYELISYDSDQSNNRFKIESNINNYYSLYNDENELSASFTNSGGTLSNESKDGFTIEVGVPNAFIAATLVNTGVSGDVIYASFNADLTGGSGGNADPSFHLSNGLDTSSVSNDEDVVSGFNSFTLTATGDFNRIRFTEGSDNRNFTISDFKVSRIERNGFVETWYDQSGNGNNATQSSADKQPFVVEHGGLCRMQNGNGAVKGTRYDASNIDFLEMDNSVAEPTTVFSTYYTNRSFALLYGGNNTGGTPRVQLNTNSIKPQFSSADDMGTTSVDNTKDSLMTLFSAENGGTAVLRKDGTQIDTLTRTEVEIRPLAFLFRHQNNNNTKGVFVDSFIVFNSDKTSDFVEIENELKIANNI